MDLYDPQKRQTNSVKILLIYLIAISLTHSEIHLYIKVALISISAVGLIFGPVRKSYLLWAAILTLLSFNLYFSYWYSSNHFFLTVYAVLATLILRFRDNAPMQERINPYRSLLAIAMGLAVLQKLINPYFMSGRLIAMYVAGGGSFYSILSVFSKDHTSIVSSYYEVFDTVKSASYQSEASVDLVGEYGSQFFIICLIISLLIVAVEGLVFLFTVRKTFHTSTYAWALLAFVWMTLAFRQEYAFFSLLLILYLLAAKDIKKPVWIAVIGSITIFLGLELWFNL